MPAALDHLQRLEGLLLLVALACTLEDLLVGALDAPGDQPAARLAHHGQHLFVHIVDTAVAGPLDLEAPLEDQFAQLHHMLAVDREEIGVHVDVAGCPGSSRYSSSSTMFSAERTRTLFW